MNKDNWKFTYWGQNPVPLIDIHQAEDSRLLECNSELLGEFPDVSKVTQCVHFAVSSGPLEYAASKRLETPSDTASHPRRPEPSAVPLWALQISHSLQLTKMGNVNEWNYGEIRVQSRLGKGSTVRANQHKSVHFWSHTVLNQLEPKIGSILQVINLA